MNELITSILKCPCDLWLTCNAFYDGMNRRKNLRPESLPIYRSLHFYLLLLAKGYVRI